MKGALLIVFLCAINVCLCGKFYHHQPRQKREAPPGGEDVNDGDGGVEDGDNHGNGKNEDNAGTDEAEGRGITYFSFAKLSC